MSCIGYKFVAINSKKKDGNMENQMKA